MACSPDQQTGGSARPRERSAQDDTGFENGMRIAYLDGFSGISGDMFLGALVDAGVPFELLQKTVAALEIDASLEMSRVNRNGISAVKIDVSVGGKKDLPREQFWEHDHEHSHSHGRHLSEILKIIAGAPISENAKNRASAIFTALGEAEAKVHNTDVDKVHFHEVGAVDAIVDIVCAAVGAEALGVDRILASPLNVGSGMVKCAHGVMPVPAPATLELLKGAPVYSGEIQKELVTPTGAAIVRTLAAGFGTIPPIKAERVGYGAGSRDFPHHSNVLRLVVGESIEVTLADATTGVAAASKDPEKPSDKVRWVGSPKAGHLAQDDRETEEEVVVLEANLDDLNPQIIGYTTERLLTEGALDVFTTAVQMKKGRPGTLVTVLSKISDEEKLRDILFQESSTLGVRSRREQRRVLARRHESVATPWGEVRIKIGSVNGTEFQAAPEYEDCRSIAAERNLPLKTVMHEALRLYLDRKR
jgi:uncharacterized protein (TIGR00299 family) protein